MKITKEKIIGSGEMVERGIYEYLTIFINQLVRGLYIFKTRKGEILAGSVTFFTVFSFCPLLLLLISLYAQLIGDVDLAFKQMMDGLKQIVPQMAPWIHKSIYTIIEKQIKTSGGFSWVNILILLYGTLGLFSSLIYASNTLAKRERKGGFLFDEIRTFFNGAILSIFLFFFFFFAIDPVLIIKTFNGDSWPKIIKVFINSRVLMIIFPLIFFSVYYKFISFVKVRFIDAIVGAISFILLIFLGKTFYWVYLHYMQDQIELTFGNFYTLVVVIIWIYYVICSFLFGVSVTLSPVGKRIARLDVGLDKDLPEIPLMK